MEEILRLSQLSGARQQLVRLAQRTNFGQVRYLFLRDGDPVFTPAPTVVLDVKLDSEEAPRPEVDLADFALPIEVRRLMSRFDAIQNGVIDTIEIRAGVPRRVIFESRLAEALR